MEMEKCGLVYQYEQSSKDLHALNTYNKTILPHSFLGSSERSLQSLMESHTLELSIHSPFLHWNFRGPSHFVAAIKQEKKDIFCKSHIKIFMFSLRKYIHLKILHKLTYTFYSNSSLHATTQKG